MKPVRRTSPLSISTDRGDRSPWTRPFACNSPSASAKRRAKAATTGSATAPGWSASQVSSDTPAGDCNQKHPPAARATASTRSAARGAVACSRRPRASKSSNATHRGPPPRDRPSIVHPLRARRRPGRTARPRRSRPRRRTSPRRRRGEAAAGAGACGIHRLSAAAASRLGGTSRRISTISDGAGRRLDDPVGLGRRRGLDGNQGDADRRVRPISTPNAL
jgi:hypothetical protein